MTIESEEELLGLQRIGRIVALTREEIVKAVRPGISTGELDEVGEKALSRHGANSAPRCEYSFPGATCISINEEVAHGIPGKRVIKSGDIVNIDVSAELDGFFADTGATVIAGTPGEAQVRLCECSLNALRQGITKARAGTRINQIGRAIYREAISNGFTVIKNLTGHGTGRRLHEEPEGILNYFDKRDSRLLKSGMVLAIESFVSTGAEYVIEASNGWTLKTPDRSLVAQYEHTIVVTKNAPVILTA